MDKEGEAKLTKLLETYTNDYWLNFIADKNMAIKSGDRVESLKFMEPISEEVSKSKQRMKTIEMDIIHLELKRAGYLSEDDFLSEKKGVYINQAVAAKVERQFKLDAGLPADCNLDTEKISKLFDVWNPMWSTKDLGVRPIKQNTDPGTDSDQLIILLRKSGFYTSESKLKRRNYGVKQYEDHQKMNKILMALWHVGSKKSPYENTVFYMIPADIETCIRVFQAYHGLTPNGDLNKETVSRLKRYE